MNHRTVEHQVGRDIKDHLVQPVLAKACSRQNGPTACPAESYKCSVLGTLHLFARFFRWEMYLIICPGNSQNLAEAVSTEARGWTPMCISCVGRPVPLLVSAVRVLLLLGGELQSKERPVSTSQMLHG